MENKKEILTKVNQVMASSISSPSNARPSKTPPRSSSSSSSSYVSSSTSSTGDAKELSRSDVEDFLRQNPNFLTNFVVKNVDSKRILEWEQLQRRASGNGKNKDTEMDKNMHKDMHKDMERVKEDEKSNHNHQNNHSPNCGDGGGGEGGGDNGGDNGGGDNGVDDPMSPICVIHSAPSPTLGERKKKSWAASRKSYLSVQDHHQSRRQRMGEAEEVEEVVSEEDEDECGPIRRRRNSSFISPYTRGTTNDADGDARSSWDWDSWEEAISRPNSITSDMYNNYFVRNRARSPCPSNRKSLNDLHIQTKKDSQAFLTELIRDIANELDVTALCHKILINVCTFTGADRSSVFLVRGPRNNPYLVSKLFDVTKDSSLKESVCPQGKEIVIPFGKGVMGLVAKNKEVINLGHAYMDTRFSEDIDKITGYKTHNLLSMPICNSSGDVLGVATIINKGGGKASFTTEDEKLFTEYLAFAGIGLMNAQLFEMSLVENKRSKILLNMARKISEATTDLEELIQYVMGEFVDLLKSQRCAVFLTEDTPSGIRLAKTFSLIMTKDGPQYQAESKERKISDGTEEVPVYRTTAEKVAIHVAKTGTGEVLNIANVLSANSEKRLQLEGILGEGELTDEEGDGGGGVEPTTSILCVPIFNSADKVIGVAQVANKRNKRAFNSSDIKAFEAFALFCGLGIHNAMLYDKVMKLNLRQEVALEVLSYHTAATSEETNAILQQIAYEDSEDEKQTGGGGGGGKGLMKRNRKHLHNSLRDFQFSDFDQSEMQTVKLALTMFKDFKIDAKFKLTDRVLCHWMLSVKKNYRPVTYHNWRHAFNVAQTMYVIMKKDRVRQYFSDLEVFLFLVASLCHDLDHRGQTNQFQKISQSALARLYSTSTLERHHFNHAVMILNSKDNNIFHALSEPEYKVAITHLETLILATDLTLFFQKWGSFRQLLDGKHASMDGKSASMAGKNASVDGKSASIDGKNASIVEAVAISSPLSNASTVSTASTTTPVEDIGVNGSGNGSAVSKEGSAASSVEVELDVNHRPPSTQSSSDIDPIINPIATAVDWRDSHNKGLLRRMLMTACDVAAIMKPWEIQRKIARLVASEFFEQGDIERSEYKRMPSAMMDRNRENELPKMQLDFIDSICLPLYQRLGAEFPELKPMYDGCLRNRNNWKALDNVSKTKAAVIGVGEEEEEDK